MKFGLIDPVPVVTRLSECSCKEGGKTAVVLGIGQGGTSMVAAVIDAIGYPVNDEGHLRNFEHHTRPCPDDSEEQYLRKIIETNSAHVRWGMKDPAIFRFYPRIVHGALRNPFYIVVTKDTTSIVQRRCASVPHLECSKIQEIVRQVAHAQTEMLNWIWGLVPANICCVSYHRAIEQREEFVDDVIAFLGDDVTEEQRSRAIARISPSGGYLLEE